LAEFMRRIDAKDSSSTGGSPPRTRSWATPRRQPRSLQKVIAGAGRCEWSQVHADGGQWGRRAGIRGGGAKIPAAGQRNDCRILESTGARANWVRLTPCNSIATPASLTRAPKFAEHTDGNPARIGKNPGRRADQPQDRRCRDLTRSGPKSRRVSLAKQYRGRTERQRSSTLVWLPPSHPGSAWGQQAVPDAAPLACAVRVSRSRAPRKLATAVSSSTMKTCKGSQCAARSCGLGLGGRRMKNTQPAGQPRDLVISDRRPADPEQQYRIVNALARACKQRHRGLGRIVSYTASIRMFSVEEGIERRCA